jgi:D-inositol-3-phosphate glycosyltransferase
VILFVGRIEPLKGLDTLLGALALMRESGVQCRAPHYLIVVGGDPAASGENLTAEMARLQLMCRDMGLNDLVLFLGKRAQDTLPYYYSSADILVMPSHYESFGMVALEAMACGTPVVASNVSSLPEIAGVAGLLANPTDPADLARAMIRVLMDPARAADMRARGLLHVKQFTWERCARETLEVIKGVGSGV